MASPEASFGRGAGRGGRTAEGRRGSKGDEARGPEPGQLAAEDRGGLPSPLGQAGLRRCAGCGVPTDERPPSSLGCCLYCSRPTCSWECLEAHEAMCIRGIESSSGSDGGDRGGSDERVGGCGAKETVGGQAGLREERESLARALTTGARPLARVMGSRLRRTTEGANGPPLLASFVPTQRSERCQSCGRVPARVPCRWCPGRTCGAACYRLHAELCSERPRPTPGAVAGTGGILASSRTTSARSSPDTLFRPPVRDAEQAPDTSPTNI